MKHPAKRRSDQLRPIEIVRNFTKYAAGSVLVKWGDTWVLCTASVDDKVPSFLKGTGKGWVTAEYAMLPSSTGGGRKDRDIKKLKQDARSTEIQRLIGRSLRAAVDLEKLGERLITIDCDVLQADGGTRLVYNGFGSGARLHASRLTPGRSVSGTLGIVRIGEVASCKSRGNCGIFMPQQPRKAID